jgi:hypothetical protein
MLPGQSRALPAGITNCVGCFRWSPGADNNHYVAGVYTIAERGPGTLGRSGLDLSASMFAPCLLGYPVQPGSTRYPQPAADTGDRTERQVTACIVITWQQVMKKN